MPMNKIASRCQAAILMTAFNIAFTIASRADLAPRVVLPDAVVDLRTTEGVARVKAQWRYSDTRINQIDHRSVGSDLKASGPPNRPFDFTGPNGLALSPDEKFLYVGNWDDSKKVVYRYPANGDGTLGQGDL